jgi:hypothetical protein
MQCPWWVPRDKSREGRVIDNGEKSLGGFVLTGKVDREMAKEATSYTSELSLHAEQQNILSYKDEVLCDAILYWHIFQNAVTCVLNEAFSLNYCSNYNN